MRGMRYEADQNTEHIRCFACDKELELIKVTACYLKSEFPTHVLCCPVCGQTYISEQLALQKIAEIERTLEEK